MKTTPKDLDYIYSGTVQSTTIKSFEKYSDVHFKNGTALMLSTKVGYGFQDFIESLKDNEMFKIIKDSYFVIIYQFKEENIKFNCYNGVLTDDITEDILLEYIKNNK